MAWIGTRKGLFRVEAAGGGGPAVVDHAFRGVPVTAFARDRRDGALYVALGHGHFDAKVHRSDDDGASWTEIATPAYPLRPEGLEEELEPMRQIPVPWSTQVVWSIEAGHPDEPGALWAGTIPGGLFRSEDRGASWTLARSLWDRPERREWVGGGYDFAGIHSLAVDPRGPGRLTLAVSCGGVWQTTDGGGTWQPTTKGMRAAYVPADVSEESVVQDPHRIVRCASDPDVVWCQHHNGVFRSADGGWTWRGLDVPPSSFGFAVAAHPTDPDTAWFVPAHSDEERIPVDGQVVVARTRDGGETFEVLTKGLPGPHAYHLVYRHALDVDASGEQLLFGSTTGTLWWSGDAGDSFETVSASLPPIATVCW